MPHDRDYYRALSADSLLTLAAENGIDPEMAVALAEALADQTATAYGPKYRKGAFYFNRSK